MSKSEIETRDHRFQRYQVSLSQAWLRSKEIIPLSFILLVRSPRSVLSACPHSARLPLLSVADSPSASLVHGTLSLRQLSPHLLHIFLAMPESIYRGHKYDPYPKHYGLINRFWRVVKGSDGSQDRRLGTTEAPVGLRKVVIDTRDSLSAILLPMT